MPRCKARSVSTATGRTKTGDQAAGHDETMVMDPIPKIDDLLWLFESEPLADSDGDWATYYPYSSVRFETRRGDLAVIFSFNPGYADARLTLERAGEPLLDLTLFSVKEVGVDRLHQEALVLRFGSEMLRDLRLVLKPAVSLTWGTFP
jgi:hypothetical protein